MSSRISAIVPLLLGLGLSAGSAYFYSSTRNLITTAHRAPGAVVGFERRLSKRGSSDYPVIEFTTRAGEVRRFTTSGAGDFAKGETVEVLYDAADPGKARVNVFIELWLGCLALGAFGLLCLGAGIGTLLYERARGKTTHESMA